MFPIVSGLPGSSHTSSCSVLCSTMNPNKSLPTANQLRYGPPSAASLNCPVSPSHRELRPYPQLSLYNRCLVVPSPTVHLTSLHQCRSHHHFPGHSNHIPPSHCWSISWNHSSSNFFWIRFPPPSHMSKLL